MKAVRWAEGLEHLLQPIDSVKPDPRNPNNGDVDAVIESIELNGFNQVITVDKKTGYIEAGHTRWAALHALGSKVAPFVYTEHDTEGRTRYLIADNETGRLAVMDHNEEVRLLRQLHETQKGLAGTGVTEQRYQDLMQKVITPDIPQIPGFGHGVAPSGIYQVVVTFYNEDERDECFADLADQYEDRVRTVNL